MAVLPEAAQAVSGTAAPAPSGDAGQLKTMLLQLFMTSARVHDLVGLAAPANWKMTDAERAMFDQQREAVRTDLTTLEKWRYQFLYHPEDAAAGGKALSALTELIPEVQRIAETSGQFGGPAAASQFKQPLSELAVLRKKLHSALQVQFPKQFPAEQVAVAPAPAGQKTEEKPKAASALPPAPVAAKAVSASAPAPSLPKVTPEEAQAALRSIYLTEARVNDLLTLLQPGEWKMQQADRELFNVRLQNTETGLKTLEKWRYQFLYHIGQTTPGERVVAALKNVIPGIENIGSNVAQYETAAAAASFDRAAKELSDYNNTVSAYVASLKSKYSAELKSQPSGLSGTHGLETVRIQPAAPAPPPLRTLAVAAPPLTNAQVKQILHQVYVSEFRVRDLLGQERPNRWKAPLAERQLALTTRADLLKRLNELETWRERFSEHPTHTYAAFQTYLAINRLFHPLRVFGRAAAKYESASIAGAYARRTADMEAQMNGLVPYVGFILQNADAGLDTYRSDLANCQNQLGYAMHQSIESPHGMKNIVPVFQGRYVRKDRAKAKRARP